MSLDTGTAMSTDQKLVYMANQIATFFKSMPEDEARAGVAKHINDFWDPRMRQRLHGILENGGEGLSPLVLSAASDIRWPGPAN